MTASTVPPDLTSRVAWLTLLDPEAVAAIYASGDAEMGHAAGFRAGWEARERAAAQAWIYVCDETLAQAKLTHEERVAARVAEMTRTPTELASWEERAARRHVERDLIALRNAGLRDDSERLRRDATARLDQAFGATEAAA